jgi:multidrug efflux pump subunit AcrB
LFENLKEPFFIISMIPLSFIGLFLTFAWGGFYFDQGGYAAFVMLGGLVTNAAIFIVNDFNNLRKKKPAALYNRLLIKAAANRARTIFLTTISACCGLIPFLIEGQNEVFWFSLAAGTIGGLLFSLCAVFVVLPVLLWKKRRL